MTWADRARRFETWENSYVNIIGLGSAVTQALHRPGTTALRHRDRRSGRPRERRHCAALAERGINVSTTGAAHNRFDTEEHHVHPLVRLSPHYYNAEDEIDRTIGAMHARPGAAA